MRRKKQKELNIFSTSALDLFASAMGAFVLIAVISLPYYLNIDQTDIVKTLKKEVEGLKLNASSLNTKIANAIEEKIQCEAEKTKLLDRMAGMGKRHDELQSQVQGQEKQIAELKTQLKNSIKFSLLGISTKATSFTILVDMSGSVKEYQITIADTIRRLVFPMKDKSKIQIVGYHGETSSPDIVSWHTPHNAQLYTSADSRSLELFIEKMTNSLGGGTPTEKALKEALKYNTDAIVLITDGSPAGEPRQIVKNISRLNNHQKEIHTIAIGNYLEKQSLTKFLINLSAKNGGGFMGVASLD